MPGAGAAGVLAAQPQPLAVLDQAAELLAEAEDVLVGAELEVERRRCLVDDDRRRGQQPGDLPQPVGRAQDGGTAPASDEASG